MTSPYNWQSHRPRVQIPRADVDRLADLLRENGSAVVMGGRGMGKSVFLGQLKAELEGDRETRVLLIEAPPPALTVEACLGYLAELLGVAASAYSSRAIFERYFDRDDAAERLVLLFDEFDRYAEKGSPSAQPPGRGFFNDLEASRRSLPRISILATGSIGIFIVRDVLGSSFLARALHLRLRPLERAEVELLAGPFADRVAPLPGDALDALLLASGGIPAILTYGLQELWKLYRKATPDRVTPDRVTPDRVTPDRVTAIYKVFKEEHLEYLRDLLRAVQDPRFSDAPRRVWERIQEGGGRIPRAELEKAIGSPSGVLNLDIVDALHLLEAVGVVRLESSVVLDDPITAHPIASLLNLPKASTPRDDVRAHFLADLTTLLSKLHRSSADFFRPTGAGKRLVPESVFAAHLALGFELLGWRTEREAQQGAGRTDLLLRRNGASEAMVVEVKIWGRNDYQKAHRQVMSYWTSEVAAGAVVQLTDADLPDWPERYRRECLEADAVVEERPITGSPIRGRFTCTSPSAGGMDIEIEHFILRLPRRS